MWLLRKNEWMRSFRGAGLLCLMLLMRPAEAGIIVDYSTVSPPPGGGRMAGIVLHPLPPQTETAYHIQRSHAWRLSRQGGPAAGAMLVHPPMVGAMGAPASQRQRDARTNLSRAHAYRLDYYKR